MKKLIAFICLAIVLQATANASPPQLLSPPVAPVGEPTAEIVEKLLQAKWDRNLSNKSESDSIYAATARDNPHVMVAYALNRINHGSVGQALKTTSEARRLFKQNWDGRILEVWLLTLTDEYDAAIVQLRSFKKQLEIAKADNRLPVAVEHQLYLRFGRLIGYLEGPVVEKVNSPLLAETVVLLEQGIDAESKKAFSLARQFVKTEYEKLLAKQTDYQNQELVKVAASNEIVKKSLEQENKLVEETRARLVPQLEQLTSESDLLTSRLDQQIITASTNLRTANQAVFRLEQQLAILYADLFRINRRNFSSVIAIENQINRVGFDLSQQRITAVNQANELSALQNELFAVRRNYQRQIAQANRSLKQTEVAQNRNNKKLQKIVVPKIAGGKNQALNNRRTALKTYDNLPLELYRQEMLDAFE